MKDFLRKNGLLILLIAVLLAAITAVFSYAFQGAPSPLSNVLGVVTTPVRNGVSSLAEWVEGIYSYTFRYDELEAENQRLQEENARLQAELRQASADSQENERLRELLGLREQRRDFVFESATVTARSSTNWASTLTLSKGADGDIAAGDCVIDASGDLVGIVEEVGANWCTVLTVLDANLEMGGLIARTESTAVLEGDFDLMGQGRLKMTYLPADTELIPGDLVLTTSMGGNYPSDLVVGTIESIHSDASGMSRYAVIAPAADLDSLVQVFVITDFDIVE